MIMQNRKWALPARLTTALALCLAATACGKSEHSKTAAPQLRTVRLAQVESRPVGGSFASSGVLVSREEALVGSELSGYRVAAVYVDEGDHVRAGQVLARLDSTLLRARIAQAQASVEQSRAQASQSRTEAARVAGLDGQGILADEQIQQRRSQAAGNAAAVAVAQAQLADLRTQASRMELRAPVSGVVLERSLQPGAIAAAGGEPLFRIARDQLIELDAEVPEDILPLLRPGGRAVVTLPSGRSLEGAIRFISPRVNADSRLGRARVRLPVDADLRPGGYAKVNFTIPAQPRPAVPEKAVLYEAAGPQIVVAQKDRSVRRIDVTLGARANGWVALAKGPTIGTPVVLGGAFLLDGDQVAVAGKER